MSKPPLPSLPDGPPMEACTDAQIEIRLVFLSDVDPSLVPAYRDLLGQDEKERFERYRVEGAREEFLVGRALVRETLGHILGMPAKDLAFVKNAYGRPSIDPSTADAHGLSFNLSHTRGLVALAVARFCEIGVDVETIARTSATNELAGRYFAPAETRFVRSATGDEQRERFFAFWTLKEAYIKARGMGLALPLDGFAFDLAGASPAISFAAHCPDDPERWAFARRPVSSEHRLALAVSPALSLRALRILRTVPLGQKPDVVLENGPSA